MNQTLTFDYDTLNHYKEHGIGDYLIVVKSSMRLETFEGMKQPIPPNSCMGYELVIDAKYKGKPLTDCQFNASWGGKEPVKFKTNSLGISRISPPLGSEIKITFSKK
ncbi:hypothetical protein N9045_00525 [bacterium]|nr:hypothetical protein [bacterium]